MRQTIHTAFNSIDIGLCFLRSRQDRPDRHIRRLGKHNSGRHERESSRDGQAEQKIGHCRRIQEPNEQASEPYEARRCAYSPNGPSTPFSISAKTLAIWRSTLAQRPRGYDVCVSDASASASVSSSSSTVLAVAARDGFPSSSTSIKSFPLAAIPSDFVLPPKSASHPSYPISTRPRPHQPQLHSVAIA